MGKTTLRITCETCGKGFEPARRGGSRIKYCSVGCRRTGDRKYQNSKYRTAAEKRQMASEVEQGYWTSESDSSDGPTGLFVDLRGGEYRPNHRTAIREALEAELAASGFEFTDDRLGSGLRPQDYDARSRALFEEYADWSPDVDRDMVYRDAGKPAPGGSPAFGGPWRHRDPGWIPVDEWFARQEDSRAYDGVPGSDAHLSYISKRL